MFDFFSFNRILAAKLVPQVSEPSTLVPLDISVFDTDFQKLATQVMQGEIQVNEWTKIYSSTLTLKIAAGLGATIVQDDATLRIIVERNLELKNIPNEAIRLNRAKAVFYAGKNVWLASGDYVKAEHDEAVKQYEDWTKGQQVNQLIGTAITTIAVASIIPSLLPKKEDAVAPLMTGSAILPNTTGDFPKYGEEQKQVEATKIGIAVIGIVLALVVFRIF